MTPAAYILILVVTHSVGNHVTSVEPHAYGPYATEALCQAAATKQAEAAVRGAKGVTVWSKCEGVPQ